MPKFVTIGYGDEAGYKQTDPNVRTAAHANDQELLKRGALIGIAGKPVQVRNPEAKGIKTQDGAYLSSSLPIAGFAVIEARDLDEATQMVGRSPCAVAHGVIEVWPLDEITKLPSQ
ncbi:MAG: transcription initiation protein [Sphingomonas sp.]|uniref:YciI family protein n=1 Tax=Sphingomonas sp. TaxID=28214 RepID=UPI0017A7F0F4|nr:YciI family protein [Sphingomonas sp.]MBA3667685.1 transcription initiation protein [Sphingomonas sp.]